MRTGTLSAEAFFSSWPRMRKEGSTWIVSSLLKSPKPTFWASKSCSPLSNWFFLAWVANVSARVNAQTLEREQKKKKKIEEAGGAGDRRKPSFSLSPPPPDQFFCSRNKFAETLATQARFFLVRVPVHWRTDGHNWALCTKRTVVLPGFETISRQHATHAQQRS